MAKNNDYDILEKEIGDYGAEPEQFGKLRLAQEPTAEEKKGLTNFKEMTDRIRGVTQTAEEYAESQGNTLVMQGWIPIDRSEMGIRSMFYPSDWEFRIKPATVTAIRNWASIDEENLAAVNNVMNEIIKTCVSINSEFGKVTWEKINSWDRFWFILKVHQYTFKQGENKIEFEDECNECGETLLYTLKPDTLFYEFPDDQVVENCWDMDKMIWKIKPQDYGLPNKPVTLYTPTIGKDNALIQWVYAQNQAGKNINEAFIKFLPYMLERPIKDMNVLDRNIKELYKEFNSWDTDMFLFMDEVIRNITINPSEKLKQKCEHCDSEVTSNVKFPNGIKRLFVVQGKHSKFGSR